MIRQDIANPPAPAQTQTPISQQAAAPAPIQQTAPPAPVTPQQANVPAPRVQREGGTTTITAQNPSPEWIAKRESEGFHIAPPQPDGTVIARHVAGAIPPGRTPIRPGPGSQTGSIDFGDIWMALRRMLGRDPSVAEIEQAMQRQVQPGEQTGRVAPFIKPGREGMDHYQLPDGTVVPTDATATKGQQVIDFQLKGGEMVKARLVRRADLDKYGEPVNPNAKPPQTVDEYLAERKAMTDDELVDEWKANQKKWGPSPEIPPQDTGPVVNEDYSPLMAYKMPEDPRPIRDTELGQVIKYTEFTGNPELDTKITRMKQIANSFRMTEDLWEELRQLGTEVTRHPNIPPGFRQKYYSSQGNPPPAHYGPPTKWTIPETPELKAYNERFEQLKAADIPFDVGPEQGGLPFGPMRIRERSQLERIADAGTKGAHEFGPVQGEFDLTPPTPKPKRGGGQEGALNVGDMAQAVKGAAKKAYDWTFKGDIDPVTGEEGPSFAGQAWALPSQATTVGDFTSAIGRQGLASIHTGDFWKALYATMRPGGGWTEEGWRQAMNVIRSDDLHLRTRDADGTEHVSFAEDIAGKGFLIENSADIGASERSAGGNWIETGGSIPYFSKGYRETIGKYYTRPSNRLYALFLNHLRTNRLKTLLENGKRMSLQALDTGEARPGFFKQKFTPEQAIELNPYQNIPLAKEMAKYVNAATGRGGLGRLESSAAILGKILFSPRLLASRIKMMNPMTYVMANPQVRKQYLGSALATVGAWIGMAQLAEKSGLDVEVSWNPKSADFGKIRIGNTRIDLGGGFQQLFVGLSRIVSGKEAPSTGGEEFELGQGYRADTRLTIIQRVLANKLNPPAKGVYDFFNASERVPLHVMDRTAQLFVPLILQDAYELSKEDHGLYTLPLLALMNFGAGTQIYEAGESVSKFIPPENDILFKGGSFFGEEESATGIRPPRRTRPQRPRPR